MIKYLIAGLYSWRIDEIIAFWLAHALEDLLPLADPSVKLRAAEGNGLAICLVLPSPIIL